MNTSGKVPLNMRVTQELDEWLREKAQREQRTIGSIVEGALQAVKRGEDELQREADQSLHAAHGQHQVLARLACTLLVLLTMLAVPGVAGAHGLWEEAGECLAIRLVTPVLQRDLEANEQVKGVPIHLEVRSCKTRPVRARYRFTVPSRHAEGGFTLTLHPVRLSHVWVRCDRGYRRQPAPQGQLVCVRA